MEPTITQNGALFAVQHRPAKRNYRHHYHRQIASPNKTISTLRTSVGEFVRTLKNGKTDFRVWDALGRKTATNQIGTLSRWNKGEQTP
jgi:hypothetical protein